MGRGGGGRDRPSVSYGPPRFVEKEQQQQQQQQHRKSSGWGIAPPSRHLWVGNLSSHVTERMLSEQFLRFGDLEKIGYVPGRSYAFVDYRKVEDAVIAMRGLQGSNLAGMLIRIEFAKGVSLEKFPVLLFPVCVCACSLMVSGGLCGLMFCSVFLYKSQSQNAIEGTSNQVLR